MRAIYERDRIYGLYQVGRIDGPELVRRLKALDAPQRIGWKAPLALVVLVVVVLAW